MVGEPGKQCQRRAAFELDSEQHSDQHRSLGCAVAGWGVLLRLLPLILIFVANPLSAGPVPSQIWKSCPTSGLLRGE